ncbi:MAG TPA: phospholipase D-like domain-containing protein [Parvibaculum sp.]|uniref:phospholipase D-like domain-containing protein n=1 Tax=Parvibaculum sp. TaxID=2024848 RepID=UPI002C577FF1|nr:phospholipase D-like domain-containing protein [Parvibaculum sp.]HMM15803.1 phospholipase D-like domain-containing protein [Parvibaculum sp.]
MWLITHLWPVLAAVIQFAAMAFAAGHAMLTKSDVRSAVGWVGFIVLVPFFGWLIYFLFGINRIQRRARELRGVKLAKPLVISAGQQRGHFPVASDEELRRLESFARFGLKLLPENFEPANRIGILENGDEAYPAMIAAIDGARHSIALSTYIMNNDRAGRIFVDALTRAVERGVRVRVLIDGVGSWYSRPSLIPLLRERGINYARFLHSFMPWQMPYLNMRNHQKILVVDGRTGFTGGMNIAEGNLVRNNPRKPIIDYHFHVEGPVVHQLMHTFAHEWEFTTGEILDGPDWFPDEAASGIDGDTIARALPAGPDMGMNPIRWTLLGALSEARERIRIVTPYFLPDATLGASLSLAAMRGVEVDIVLPGTNNLPFVDWAATPQLLWLIEAGCRVWKSEGPFEHTKLMTVDNVWSTVGSANWDGRSLRLNFELNLECYGGAFAARLARIIDGKIAAARPVTYQEIAGRPLPVKLRDAFVRLASPYL